MEVPKQFKADVMLYFNSKTPIKMLQKYSLNDIIQNLKIILESTTEVDESYHTTLLLLLEKILDDPNGLICFKESFSSEIIIESLNSPITDICLFTLKQLHRACTSIETNTFFVAQLANNETILQVLVSFLSNEEISLYEASQSILFDIFNQLKSSQEHILEVLYELIIHL